VLGTALWAQAAHSFCGFYVAAGDAQLFNRSSKVVLVRDGDRTVLTMANDFRGDPREFAIVVPVPTLLEQGQIHVGDPALVNHLDAYSAPRLVEYFDESPCNLASEDRLMNSSRPMAVAWSSRQKRTIPRCRSPSNWMIKALSCCNPEANFNIRSISKKGCAK